MTCFIHRGDIEQDQQRVRLLTQQLTSDTNEVTELEKKVEMLKKHLAATEKNLGTKQDRIKRLQKEVNTAALTYVPHAHMHACTHAHTHTHTHTHTFLQHTLLYVALVGVCFYHPKGMYICKFSKIVNRIAIP